MSNHFVGVARGTATGFKFSDFTTGASSTSTLDFELRIADLDQNSVAMTRKDVILALKQLEYFIENGGLQTTFPPL